MLFLSSGVNGVSCRLTLSVRSVILKSMKIAIVTGASGGMGKEFVRLLAQNNHLNEIWAIARSEDKLNALKAELGEKIRVIPMDLTERNHYSALAALLQESDAQVEYLVNNAGFAKFCSYDDIDVAETLNMIDLNIGATVAMGLITIPFLQKGGKILNIASQAAFQPLPYMNVYAATKAFVLHYTRALNTELKDRGITATAVCPGWMNTDFYTRGEVGAKKAPRSYRHMSSPEAVARKALGDAARGKDISVYRFYVKCCHAAAKLLPQKRMMKLWLRQQRIK